MLVDTPEVDIELDGRVAAASGSKVIIQSGVGLMDGQMFEKP